MHLRGEREGHTLDSGALVHEAYLRLRTAAPEAAEGDSAAFLRMAARVMRETLVDHARRRHAKKRGGRDAAAAPPEDSKEAMTDGDAERLLLLEDALVRLQEQDAQAARLVEYRAFGGMTLEEAADALQLSHRTARRRWSFAKAWLQRELSP
jgi:RNA polymerase sigma factor (TIGR02999 family)